MRDASKAIANYTKAIDLNTELAEAYGNRGMLKAQTGDKQGGIVDLKQAADLFRKQGHQENYQQTLVLIQKVEQQ